MPDIKEIYNLFITTNGISTDTRKDVKNTIFFALSGENFDGNKFAEVALEKGAAYAVIDNPEYKKDDRYILVENVLETLQKLANYHRKQFTIPFMGITGTNGKTTTKELVSAVLKSKYNIISTEGNLNNHIGVPLTVLKVKRDTEITVIEMGANHPEEIAFLCEIAKPTHGIITNIGKAHLEGFGSFEGVKNTKKELYDYLKKNYGTAFVNRDDSLLMELSEGIKRVLYCSNDCDLKGSVISNFPFLKVKIDTKQEAFEISTKLYGSYNLPNILAAVAVGKHFDVPDTKIKSAIENYVPSNNRSQITKTENNTIIQDAYNANPVSLTKAVESFYSSGFENPCLILGDMFELGKYSLKEHQKIADIVKEKGFDCVYLVGKEFFRTKNLFTTFESTEQAAEFFENNPLKNKTILLKGSRGMHLETLLKYL